MALEFALRPRLNLERPAPQRRRYRWRLPALALPMVAYWLATAGGTYLLLGVLRDAPASDNLDNLPITEPMLRAHAAAENAAPEPPPEPAFELAAPAAPAPAAPAPETDELAAPAARALAAPAPAAPTPAALAAPTPAAPTPAAPAAPALETDDPAPRQREIAKAPVTVQPTREVPSISLPSCESAAASANQSIDLRAERGAPDLTRDALAGVLENGAYLASCAIPARTALEICAAVQDGKVVGVSVTSEPRDPALGACVRRAVAALHFPRSARLDVTRTRFEAASP